MAGTLSCTASRDAIRDPSGEKWLLPLMPAVLLPQRGLKRTFVIAKGGFLRRRLLLRPAVGGVRAGDAAGAPGGADLPHGGDAPHFRHVLPDHDARGDDPPRDAAGAGAVPRHLREQ
jgi:hypothetical protein